MRTRKDEASAIAAPIAGMEAVSACPGIAFVSSRWETSSMRGMFTLYDGFDKY